MTDVTPDNLQDQKAKEAYFTASQGQLIWARFKKQRAALVAAVILVAMMLSGIFAPFLSPYDPTIAGPRQGLHQRRATTPQILR